MMYDVRMNNILVNIAKEDGSAVVSPAHVQDAINRGIPQADICICIVDIIAENQGSYYLEDRGCCCFVAMQFKKP